MQLWVNSAVLSTSIALTNATSWGQRVCAVGIAALALACGDGSADDEGGARESISSAPLSGKLAGKTFTAVSATASFEYEIEVQICPKTSS